MELSSPPGVWRRTTDGITTIKSADRVSINSLVVDTTTLVVDATNDRVGIGTASPGNKLSVEGNGTSVAWTNGTGKGGLYTDNSNVAFGSISNHPIGIFTNNGGFQMVLTTGGHFGVGANPPESRLEVQTTSTIGNQAVTIDQDDADQAFIDFQGTSAASAANNISTWTVATIAGYVKIEINGAAYWMPYYDAPTS